MRKQHFVRLTGSIAALGLVQIAGAANVSFTINPAFEQEYITGSPSAIGAGRVDVVRDGSGNEARGVWEFGLPALAPGYTLNSATLNSYVGALQGSTSTFADVSFHGYPGNGVFSASDGTVPFNQIARTGPMTTGGTRSDPLSVSYLQSRYTAGSTHLGVMGYAEVTGFRAGFNSAGSSGGPTRVVVNATVPDAGTIVAEPVVDARVTTNDLVNYTLTDGETVIGTQYVPQFNIERRGILEYHLGGVPNGADITSAKITFNLQVITTSGSDGPNIRLYGYSGNGLAELADMNQTFNLLATGNDTTELGAYEVNLSTSLIESLLSSGNDYLGIVAFGSADGNQFGFYANESTSGPPAMLSVTYAVPEPAAMALLAPFALLLRRRARR